MQNKPCTLRNISSQREALYLYRVNFRSTSPRLDYLLKGGLISLLDRLYLEKRYADETSVTSILISHKVKADIFFIYFLFIFIFFTLRSNLAYSQFRTRMRQSYLHFFLISRQLRFKLSSQNFRDSLREILMSKDSSREIATKLA